MIALGVILLTVLSYIDFAPKPSDAGLFVIPAGQAIPAARAEIAGVRIDGEPVTFLRDGLVEDLHRALIEGRALVRRDGNGFECTAFALLMSGVSLARVGKRFRVTPSLEEAPTVDDIHQDYPLAIGDWPRFCKVPIYFHALVPAHTPDAPLYLHKLGDKGPVCISGVNEAMKVVGGSRLARVSSMRVSIGNQAVASWEHGNPMPSLFS